MATIQELLDQINTIIKDKNPDYREIDSVDLHTHTVDDIPQLTMMFNSGRFAYIEDIYYNSNSKVGYINYSNGLLINYGRFTYNNKDLKTNIIFPLSYNLATNYSLFYNKVTSYNDTNYMNEPFDNTYDIRVISKEEWGFIVTSTQLYIPPTITYNYFALGFRTP